jgi:predicted DNA-binding protein (MmcQ/YjbR family)
VIKVGGRMFAFVPLSGWFRVVNLKCDPAHKPRGRGSVFQRDPSRSAAGTPA